MHQFMSAIGRKASVANLDPANDRTGYPCALDIRDIITLDAVMDEEGLGPNGGVMYALEELEGNVEWLEEGLSRLGNDYVLFDCPGQVEMFTHHDSLRKIFMRLQKMGYRVSRVVPSCRVSLFGGEVGRVKTLIVAVAPGGVGGGGGALGAEQLSSWWSCF